MIFSAEGEGRGKEVEEEGVQTEMEVGGLRGGEKGMTDMMMKEKQVSDES